MTEEKWQYNIGDSITVTKDDGSLLCDYIITNREIRTRKKNAKKEQKNYVTERFYEYACNICGAK